MKWSVKMIQLEAILEANGNSVHCYLREALINLQGTVFCTLFKETMTVVAWFTVELNIILMFMR